MLPTSLALAWTMWRRHHWGLLLALAYLVLALISTAAVLMLSAQFDARAINGTLFIVVYSFLHLAFYLIAVVSYGFDADVNGAGSCFPQGLLRLPVRTSALVAWPMAYGAALIALLWLITGCFILRPWLALWNLSMPLWWPGALAVACVACAQALLWSPLGLRGLRIVLLVVLMSSLAVAIKAIVASGASEGVLVGLCAGIAVTAWGIGYLGVELGRRGEAPNWDLILRPFRRSDAWLTRRRKTFIAPDRAQVWLEWRRHGAMLPLLTAVVLPFLLLYLSWLINTVTPKSSEFPMPAVLALTLLAPVFFAGIAAGNMAERHPWVKDYYGLTSFVAKLPLSTASLAAAKLKAAAFSTLIAWAIMGVGMPLALALTGNLPVVLGWLQKGLETHQPLTLAAGIVFVAAMLIVWTWKRLVASVFYGVTGGKWIIKGAVLASMAGYVGVWMLGAWFVSDPGIQPIMLSVLPWLLAALNAGRLLAAAWALWQSLKLGLLQTATVRRWLLCWLLLAAALVGLIVGFVPLGPMPAYYIVFAVLLVMPMARLAALPLVLASNRHR